MKAKNISLFENGRMKGDGQIHADLHYDGFATADAAGKKRILAENSKDFKTNFGDWYYNLYDNFYANMSGAGQYYSAEDQTAIAKAFNNMLNAAAKGEDTKSYTDAYSAAFGNGFTHLAESTSGAGLWSMFTKLDPQTASQFQYADGTDDVNALLDAPPSSMTSEALATSLKKKYGDLDGSLMKNVFDQPELAGLNMDWSQLSADQLLAVGAYLTVKNNPRMAENGAMEEDGQMDRIVQAGKNIVGEVEKSYMEGIVQYRNSLETDEARESREAAEYAGWKEGALSMSNRFNKAVEDIRQHFGYTASSDSDIEQAVSEAGTAIDQKYDAQDTYVQKNVLLLGDLSTRTGVALGENNIMSESTLYDPETGYIIPSSAMYKFAESYSSETRQITDSIVNEINNSIADLRYKAAMGGEVTDDDLASLRQYGLTQAIDIIKNTKKGDEVPIIETADLGLFGDINENRNTEMYYTQQTIINTMLTARVTADPEADKKISSVGDITDYTGDNRRKIIAVLNTATDNISEEEAKSMLKIDMLDATRYIFATPVQANVLKYLYATGDMKGFDDYVESISQELNAKRMAAYNANTQAELDKMEGGKILAALNSIAASQASPLAWGETFVNWLAHKPTDPNSIWQAPANIGSSMKDYSMHDMDEGRESSYTKDNNISEELSVVEVEVSEEKYPESTKHIQDAINNGYPEILTINRGKAKSNRKASLKGIKKVPGLDLDEYPPAMFEEGGEGASVRPINQSDNRGAGSTIGLKLRPFPNGTKVRIVVKKQEVKK